MSSDKKSTWNHRIMAHQNNAGEICFMIHEVYYTDGVPTDYTSHGVRVVGDDVVEIKNTLLKMQSATLLPVLWYGDRFPEEYKE